MKMGTYNQLRILCVLSLAASFGLTGCKGVGSWKMPKMSWNREPSATTLAGTETPKLPESPANKYSPSTIASVGAGTSPGTTSGNKAPTYGYAGQTSPTASSATTGLAATANGYQTGPYTVGQKSITAGNQSTNPTNSVATGLPNPYGGSYAGVNPSRPGDVALPNSVKGELANYPKPNSNTVPASTASTGYGLPATQPSAYSNPSASLPPIPSASIPSPYASTTASNPYQNLPPLPSIGTNNAPSGVSAPTQPVAATAPRTAAPAVPSFGGTSVPIPTGNTLAPATATTAVDTGAANRYSGTYQPGTTARQTTYNFGTGAPATAPAATATQPAVSLPPNTASGAGPGLTNPSIPVLR